MSLQIENWKIRNGHFELGPIAFHFQSSGPHLILGANGRGKTSLLRSFMGRLRPESGRIHGLELPIAAVGIEGMMMGQWTVVQNLKWFSSLLGQRFLPAHFSYIERFFPIMVDHLSAGMRRQVELCLAMQLPFRALFLDEPLSPLDEKNRDYFREKIISAAKDRLVLLTSHEPDAPKLYQAKQVLQL